MPKLLSLRAKTNSLCQNNCNKLSTNMKYFYLSLAIGALIRIIGLDFQSLWLDELYSVLGVTNNKTFIELHKNWLTWESEGNPPFYYVFLFYWVKIFGESVISIRLPSAIAGILSIYFMYRYTKNYFSEEIAVMSSILISFSYASLYYSQEARAYSFLILFSILSTFYWFKLLFDTNHKVSDVVKYIIIIIITAYNHYFGLLLVSIQLGYWGIHTIYYKKSIRHPAITILAFMLAYLPWAFIMMDLFLRLGGGIFWIPRPTLSFYTNYLALLFRPANLSFYMLIVAPLFIGFKFHTGNLLNLIKNHFSLKSPLFALIFLVAAMIITSTLISLHTPILVYRNLLGIAPLIYLFISIYISLSAINKKHIVSYVFLSCLLFLIIYLPAYYNDPHKQQYREAAAYVIEEASNDSIIIHSASAATGYYDYNYAEMFNYYFRYFDYDSNRVYDDLNGFAIDDVENFYRELKKLGTNELFILESIPIESWLLDEKTLDYYKDKSIYYKHIIYNRVYVHHFTF